MRSAYSTSLHFFGPHTPASLAQRFGSPLYVYNEALLRQRAQEMASIIQHPRFRASFSTKANANPTLLRIIREEGLKADAMSPGELALVKAAGFTKQDICYVCNNVDAAELALAAKEASYVSVDSLSQVAAFGKAVPGGRIMVRLNPGVGAGHHAKVVTAGKNTKFGVSAEELPELVALLRQHNLTLVGLNQHVGSLFLEGQAYLAAAEWLLHTAELFPTLEVIDFGGGFGIPYNKYENTPRLDLATLGAALTALVSNWAEKTGYTGQFFTEPGRYVVAECGILLGTVHAVKNSHGKRYVGTDLGFSILARPMMYDAFHDLEVYTPAGEVRPELTQQVVGNICETGDVLAKDRLLPELREGDTIGVLDAGAYGITMSSNYNQRLRPAEVLITQTGEAQLIRQRDTLEDILRPYQIA